MLGRRENWDALPSAKGEDEKEREFSYQERDLRRHHGKTPGAETGRSIVTCKYWRGGKERKKVRETSSSSECIENTLGRHASLRQFI